MIATPVSPANYNILCVLDTDCGPSKSVVCAMTSAAEHNSPIHLLYVQRTAPVLPAWVPLKTMGARHAKGVHCLRTVRQMADDLGIAVASAVIHSGSYVHAVTNAITTRNIDAVFLGMDSTFEPIEDLVKAVGGLLVAQGAEFGCAFIKPHAIESSSQRVG